MEQHAVTTPHNDLAEPHSQSHDQRSDSQNSHTYRGNIQLNTIDEAIRDIAAGKPVIVVDDEDPGRRVGRRGAHARVPGVDPRGLRRLTQVRSTAISSSPP